MTSLQEQQAREAKLVLLMNRRMNRLRKKYPRFCSAFLVEMHQEMDWYEKNLRSLRGEIEGGV
jgi:hypothetical protein